MGTQDGKQTCSRVRNDTGEMTIIWMKIRKILSLFSIFKKTNDYLKQSHNTVVLIL
jgi:hypothetical protein